MKKLCILFLLFLWPLASYAQDSAFDYNDFVQIPILHDGRIKPLDSFARVMLKRVSGEKSLPGMSADAWLANVLFSPAQAMEQNYFTVRSSNLVAILGLPQSSEKKYSFTQLSKAFTAHENEIATLTVKDPKLYSGDERELVDLYAATRDFAEIAGTFSLLLPLTAIDADTRHALHLSEGDVDYLDVLKVKEPLVESLTRTVKRKGDRLNNYTAQETGYAKLAFTLHMLETLDRDSNNLMRVIPPLWVDAKDWLAPWAVIREGRGSPKSVRLFAHWQTLAKAYRTQDMPLWKLTAHALLEESGKAETVRPWALKLEVIYNQLEPLHISQLGYGAALFILCMGFFAVRWPCNKLAYGLMSASVVLHAAAILTRMAILGRPPVSTLYESMIFVSFLAACFGLWMERKTRNAGSLGITAIIAVFLLLSADMFAGTSDTLEVLVAVLNTNFWLATHVVCITTGYSTALFTGALAHLYLFKRATGKATAAELAAASKRIYHAAIVALLFTAVGTMLGGIWADQSWGRFWGWDPKENGALWIVLWLIWLLHGRLAGQLRDLGFAVIAAFITIVVALAWVGVNLLSVGLHSYGFTNEAANGLMLFCGGEIVVITLLSFLCVWQKKVSLQH